MPLHQALGLCPLGSLQMARAWSPPVHRVLPLYKGRLRGSLITLQLVIRCQPCDRYEFVKCH